MSWEPHVLLPWVGVFGIGFFMLLENSLPARRWTQPKWTRWLTNFSVSFCNLLIVDQIFVNILKRTEIFKTIFSWDLYGYFHLNSAWRIICTIVILDFMMYAWHRLNHVVPFFWRFHKVHHTDLDLDVTSASRFHFGETTMAAIISYAFMLALGATLIEVRIFKLIFVIMTEFAHSNVRVWKPLEKWIWLVLVPPEMHRVHHSDIPKETNSNYGAIFSFWDRMFGTFCRVKDTQRIRFGLTQYQNPKELTLLKLLKLPFKNENSNQKSEKFKGV